MQLHKTTIAGLALVLVGVLPGCRVGVGVHDGSFGIGVSTEVPPRSLESGQQLELHQPLTVGADRTRVFLQAGKALTGSGFDRYRPHCAFEIDRIAPVPRQIQPGSWRITHTSYEEVEVVALGDVQVARLGGLFFADHYGPVVGLLRMYLDTEPGGDMPRHLTCGGSFDSPYDVQAPSRAQIDQTLGNLATISSTPTP